MLLRGHNKCYRVSRHVRCIAEPLCQLQEDRTGSWIHTYTHTHTNTALKSSWDYSIQFQQMILNSEYLNHSHYVLHSTNITVMWANLHTSRCPHWQYYMLTHEAIPNKGYTQDLGGTLSTTVNLYVSIIFFVTDKSGSINFMLATLPG